MACSWTSVEAIRKRRPSKVRFVTCSEIMWRWLLKQAVESFENLMVDIDGLVAPDSATTYQLNQALRDLAQAGREIQLLARTLEEQPEALLRGRSGDK